MNVTERMFALWRPGAAALSGVLLAAAFPPFECAQVAWVALIPFLLAVLHDAGGGAPMPAPLLRQRIRVAFRVGGIAGLTFWLTNMAWLLTLCRTSPAPVVLIVAAWLLLAGYCALYVAAFAATTAWAAGKLGCDRIWKNMVLTLLIPVLWVGGEMVRSWLFSGFPWNLLGVSQFRNVVLIQSAEWVGVAGISALVMLMNTGLAFTVLRQLPPRQERHYRPNLELFIALAVVALAFRAGIRLVREIEPASRVLQVAAVQPAIPQVKKWTEDQVNTIHSTLRSLTEQALREGESRPDLIIWPETATPYCVTDDRYESRELVLELSRRGVPLLVGSMDIVGLNHEVLCFNASILFGTNGMEIARYNKQHLVPFGEVVPLSDTFPWLAQLAPMGWNCTAGRVPTVFDLGSPSRPFSCLICFEDIMAGLSRAAVKAGARLLVNQTNDAWFDGSAGPNQHLSHCVFRCVENRVSAIRIANTGVSCLIEPSGMISGDTRNSARYPPEAATPRWQVGVPGEEFQPTWYTRYGDITFGIPCGIVALIGVVLTWVAARRRQEHHD